MAIPSGINIPPGFGSIDKYVVALRQMYKEYAYLPAMHIVDFLVEDHWNELPSEWREYFDSGAFDMESLIPMASQGILPSDCPRSLSEFVSQMFALRFPRSKIDIGASSDTTAVGHIEKYFLNGMKPKKQAEVIDLAHLVSGIADSTGAELVVDVGAGQGYLSRVVAYSEGGSRASVLAVDFAQGQKRGAEVFQKRLIKQLRGTRAQNDGYCWKEGDEGRLVHCVVKVGMDTTGELVQMARDVAGERKWMLCGLHACGDLSSAILKAFVESDASAVALVPCCYNFISENCGEMSGFPLSAAFGGVDIGINALKTACQATVRWEAKTSETMESFKRNYFRALLHHFMIAEGQLSKSDEFPKVGGVTNTELAEAMEREHLQDMAEGIDKEFALYVYAALHKVNNSRWHPGVAECVRCRQSMSHGFRQMAVVWTLRSIVGPLIEGMLVVDRAMYLAQHCSSVSAFALFDPVTSPRNVVLVARR
ncbi:hypothetical protein FBU59_000527 [Linderina macrospora]|uniref:Uncharacterized protein n=1 Tax=Linderina macrospora TaxID=4868 RepID=A0ACC1JGY3_9FUNG|nr:hypothetical protein FBU59_000527 [Linderina macrospora]